MHTTARARIRVTLLCLTLLAMLGALSTCGFATSTDAICDDACTAWDLCILDDDDMVLDCQVKGWPYDACWETCKREGDWPQEYADCVSKYNDCCDMELKC